MTGDWTKTVVSQVRVLPTNSVKQGIYTRERDDVDGDVALRNVRKLNRSEFPEDDKDDKCCVDKEASCIDEEEGHRASALLLIFAIRVRDHY